MNLNLFKEELQKLNIELTDLQLEQLHKYYELLVEYNKVMNLTGITEEKEVYLKHFYDSLTLAKVIDFSKDINYDKIHNLASEAKQKLNQIRPTSIGQALRISGVNPADISLLMVYIKKEYFYEQR